MERLCKVTIIIGLVFLLINILFIGSVLASSLSVELIDIDTGVSGVSEFTFDDHASATRTNSWIRADQYAHIEFDCDYNAGYWGLRIITDNLTDTVAVDGDEPVGVDDGSGNMSYGGVIKVTLDDYGNITSVTDDPARRIALCWQVYNQNDAVTIASVVAPTVSDDDGNGIYEDDNVSTNWYEGDWAYVGDKSDDNLEDAVYYTNDDGYDVANYNTIAYGVYTYWFFRWLVPHPEDPDPYNVGDMEDRVIYDLDDIDVGGDGQTETGWDIYVFLAGRFWNTAYADVDGDDVTDISEYFQLPNGDYETTIYIEIFHE